MFNKIGIIGLGLIGGSLAKALKNRCHVQKIVAFNRHSDVLKLALKEGVIDEYATDITNIFENCDIIFICTPVDKIFEYAQKLLPFVRKDCIITDVGSTKNSIYKQIKTISDKVTFIGGHPMTGSEKFRYQASKEHLFENAYYIITPGDSVSDEKINCFKSMIETIGAIPVVVSSEEHDYIVASISHVPHIIASTLVNNVNLLDTKQKHMHLLAAGGFKDITRIASSSPDMWESICADNKDKILDVLTSFESLIKQIKQNIQEENHAALWNHFEHARTYRDSFTTITPASYVKRYEITVDVLDKPGSIAIIAVLFSSNNINIKNMSIVNNREQDTGVLNFAFDSEEQRQKSIQLLKDMNYEVYIKD